MTVWYILSFLFMQTSFGLQGQHILQQSSMCQKDIPAGDFGFYFDGEEIFYVDPESKEVRFRLPEMEQFFTFEAQSALHLLAVCKENLDVLIQWTERKSGPTVPPHVEVYPIQPVQLGKPNTLICSANGLFPSVVNITWSKNGIPVEEGIQTTDFYPRKEFTFERFSYLTFIPDEEDIYSCTVEHPAFDRPDTVFWQPMALSEDESKKLSFSIPRKPKGVFLLQKISECLFLNGNQDMVLLIRTIYNKEEQVYYDSRVGNFTGVTVVGKFLAKHWNDDTAYLEHVKGMLETFCKFNYNLVKKPLMERKVIPTITIRPLKAVIQEHPNLLMCVTSGFYPQNINVTLLKNGGEVTHDIASSGVIPNGDWTYQITLLMEFIPQKEDVYSCKVEHSSLKEPMIMDWKYPGAKLSK